MNVLRCWCCCPGGGRDKTPGPGRGECLRAGCLDNLGSPTKCIVDPKQRMDRPSVPSNASKIKKLLLFPGAFHSGRAQRQCKCHEFTQVRVPEGRSADYIWYLAAPRHLKSFDYE
ncbi:hypothetical protein B0T26DRAFT_727445 [Lasiosphaeria miniovina]|uniref:Uncharacterized protein n=1 Tax=Lasiosphaeria miniovina TaxID=1954250 RepID=A0AA39ZZR3_9PEZI|nr:uncharacterized protein B0T26DRAFT_727445 [Lasiosphaeria miniovina]KAK0706633.1 hypothetical protein B0T26DRAFT_727445 [Lasiosphaeria miniovina]